MHSVASGVSRHPALAPEALAAVTGLALQRRKQDRHHHSPRETFRTLDTGIIKQDNPSVCLLVASVLQGCEQGWLGRMQTAGRKTVCKAQPSASGGCFTCHRVFLSSFISTLCGSSKPVSSATIGLAYFLVTVFLSGRQAPCDQTDFVLFIAVPPAPGQSAWGR